MNAHIVLIEDDAEIARLITMILTETGYLVSHYRAYTNKEELAALKPDLFIIDERLPAVSGHVICMMLRGYLPTRRVPQLLMSASPILPKFADLGKVNAMLRKPFEIDTMLNTVASLLEK